MKKKLDFVLLGMLISVVSLQAADVFEPNNSILQSTPLGGLGYVRHAGLAISPVNDVDYFSFSNRVTGTLSVDLIFSAAAGSIDFALQDTRGGNLAASTSVLGGKRISYAMTTYRSSLLYVFGALRNAVNTNYTLLAEMHDSFEPNDSFAQPTQVRTFGSPTQPLSLHTNDVDYFSFLAPYSGALKLNVAFRHAEGDVDIQLFNSTNNPPVASSASTTDNESLQVSVLAGQTYFLKVFGYRNARQPSYTLRADWIDRFEPNDTQAAATDLGTSTYRVEPGLTVHQANNDDYYRILPGVSGTINFSIDFSHSSGDLDLQLLDASSNVLSQSTSTSDGEKVSRFLRGVVPTYARVYGYAGATHPQYTLRAWVDDRFEPNDVDPIVWPVASGVTLSGLTLPPGDADRYSLSPSQNGQYTVKADFVHASGDLDLQAFNGFGQLLTSSSTATNREHVTFNVVTGQTYVVRAYESRGQSQPLYSMTVIFTNALDTDFDGQPDDVDTDDDMDGLPDTWENEHGLNPLDNVGANGANGDPDGDGRSNAQEYAQGTNPTVHDLVSDPFERVYGGYIGQRFVPSAFMGGVKQFELQLHDFDFDDDQDLFIRGWTVSSGGGVEYALFMLENQGSPGAPQWSAPTPLALPVDDTFAFADIDGDGDSDFFKANGKDITFVENTGRVDRIAWAAAVTPYRNSADWSKGPGGAQGTLKGIRFADIDADGDLDVLFGRKTSGEGLAWVKNTGTVHQAAFGAAVLYNLTLPPSLSWDFSPLLSDIDGDKDLDVFLRGINYTSNTAEIVYFRNTGTISNALFAAGQGGFAVGVLPSLYSLSFMSAADLDGDDDADFLVGQLTDSSLVLNTGTVAQAAFAPREDFLIYLNGGERSQPALGDINGDGDLDMFVGYKLAFGEVGRQVEFFENTGSASTPVWRFPVRDYFDFANDTSSEYGGIAPNLADLNGDGDLDLIYARDGSTNILMRQNVGSVTNPVWAASSSLVFAVPGVSPSSYWDPPSVSLSVAVGDVDGDAVPDLVYAETGTDGDNQLHVVINQAPGPGAPVWGAPLDLDSLSDFYEAYIQLFDYNRDGTLDILVSGYLGNPSKDGPPVRLYLNPGSITNVSNYIPVPGMTDFVPGGIAVHDLDADGDPDAIFGDVYGGLRWVRNARENLAVEPLNSTVVAGDGLKFKVGGIASNLTWTVLLNRSGAVVSSNGNYTAGSTQGVDIVEVHHPGSGLKGRAFVNVISAAAVSSVGKAVIVAGAKNGNDPIWFATDRLVRKAYRALRLMGFSRQNIVYLSFDPARDIDGNGQLDDIDGNATLANVRGALTNTVANAERLFVYLCDHGSDAAGQAHMRLGPDETLPITMLDQWLDAYQNARTGTVTVVADFCYSGSVLDELSYNGAADRIVVSATAANELTYFIAGGLVSFSDVFLSAMMQNMTVFQSFKVARDAMSTYQNAQLDDDGNGVYTPGIDGPFAKVTKIGATSIVGQDVPQIGNVNPNQAIEGLASVRLWADNISAPYPVKRVWCVVVPPNHAPDLNEGNPITDLPELDLIYNSLRGRYEVDFSDFSEQGTYSVIFFAEDIWGGVSFPKQSYITQSGIDERVILVAGGPASGQTWPAISAIARFAYSTCKTRRIDDAHIYHMSRDLDVDWDDDGTNEVDALLSTSSLAWAVTNWAAAADRLTVYMVGEGENNRLRLNTGALLNPVTFDAWLDTFQASNRALNVIMDFDGSGDYVKALAAPVNRERIVIASTGVGRASLLASDGYVSFSQYFLSEIFQGKTLGEAAVAARKTIRRISGRARQRAEINDDGDAVSNEKDVDGVLASTRYLGAAFVTGDDIPQITATVPHTVLVSTNSLLIWARASDVDGISNLWVEISAPDYDGTTEPERLDLVYAPAEQRFKAIYPNFDLTGLYTLTFYAFDGAGNLSPAVQSAVTVAPPVNQPDVYEVDNSVAQASTYSMSQVHSFHNSNDVDWTKIYMISNFVYDIETVHHGDTIDTVIDVFYQKPDGTLTNVDTVDEFGREEGEFTGLDHPADGWYFVRVSRYSGESFSPGAYTLMIDVPAGNGGVIVMALNVLTGEALPPGTGASIDQGSVVSFGGQKSVWFNLSPSQHTIEVLPVSGYREVESSILPGQVDNPDNEVFGNARHITPEDVNVGASGFAMFGFFPYVTVDGSVRDRRNGKWLSGASLSFTHQGGPLNNTTFSEFPGLATYATPWKTEADGTFPSNVILFAGQTYRFNLALAGYSNVVQSGAVTATTAGSSVNLGQYLLVPIDNNHNGIPDAWELAHFGTNVMPQADHDGDGLDNLDESLAGTDPTNAASVLSGELLRATNVFTLRWGVVPGLAYEVKCGPSLTSGSLQPVFGPSTAAVAQTIMSWSDTNAAPANKRYYRIGVRVTP